MGVLSSLNIIMDRPTRKTTTRIATKVKTTHPNLIETYSKSWQKLYSLSICNNRILTLCPSLEQNVYGMSDIKAKIARHKRFSKLLRDEEFKTKQHTARL